MWKNGSERRDDQHDPVKAPLPPPPPSPPILFPFCRCLQHFVGVLWPDGRRIAYLVRRPNTNIIILNWNPQGDNVMEPVKNNTENWDRGKDNKTTTALGRKRIEETGKE